jgi:2,5-diketo-D-gluconate reductase A
MKFNLNDGNQIPAIGFGTYLLKGVHGMQAIIQALNNGYRLLDCAGQYENEGTVGTAIKKSGVPRSQIFVTSKLPGRHHRYHEAIEQIEESLYCADLDYFDLYLIHWPNPLEDHYVEAWQALIDAQKFGLIRSIGVSNFEPEHIDRIVKETGVTPAVNQVELHPYWSSKKIRQYDEEHHIVTEAWSPLTRMKQNDLFAEPIIKQLAAKYHKTPVQIVLRWELQLPTIPIPKAHSTVHQLSNLDIFDFALTADEVAAMTALDQPDGRRADRDPHTHQEF